MTNLPLNIREFRKDDLETLWEIDRICFPPNTAFSKAEFRAYLKHPRSIARVGERLGRILGFVMACVESQQWAHVITLDVIPEARRSGLGALLMNTLHGELSGRGVETIILEVNINNLAAQRLYGKLHYRLLERLPRFYHGEEDAYRLIRFQTSKSACEQ